MRYLNLNSLSKSIVFKLLRKLKAGKIIINDHGKTTTFSGLVENPNDIAIINIQHPSAYRKILFGGSIGAGKSFIDGDWDTDNLVKVIDIFIKNQELFESIDSPISRLVYFIYNLYSKMFKNNIKRAKENIIAHYDLGNDFFKLFLDPSMMYSCALYEPEEISLDEASLTKIKTICTQLDLKPTDHLLEIGTGWGGFAIYAAKHYGCKITTTTISDKQYLYVKEKISKLGLEHQIEVVNVDYRNLSGSYDKIVSIEMIEAVGHQYFDQYFNTCNKLLKPNGLFFLQAIVINDKAYSAAKNQVDFIKKYIFPGGCLPSVHAISSSISTQTNLQLTHFRDIGKHYVKTLQDWQTRLLENLDAIYAQGFSEEFLRMWQFYFSYCIAGFSSSYISDIHAVWRKRK